MSEFIPNLVNPNPKAQEPEEVVEEEIIEEPIAEVSENWGGAKEIRK
jgi:hypothetical protein